MAQHTMPALPHGSTWHTQPCTLERWHTTHYPSLSIVRDGRAVATVRIASRTAQPSEAETAGAAKVLMGKLAEV